MRWLPTRTVFVVLLICWGRTGVAVAQAVPMDSMPFVISHVTVIDATGSPAMPGIVGYACAYREQGNILPALYRKRHNWNTREGRFDRPPNGDRRVSD